MNYMLSYKVYKIFSTLDLHSGYYHIGLSDSAKPKTAFVISGMGKYEFNRSPIWIWPRLLHTFKNLSMKC